MGSTGHEIDTEMVQMRLFYRLRESSNELKWVLRIPSRRGGGKEWDEIFMALFTSIQVVRKLSLELCFCVVTRLLTSCLNMWSLCAVHEAPKEMVIFGALSDTSVCMHIWLIKSEYIQLCCHGHPMFLRLQNHLLYMGANITNQSPSIWELIITDDLNLNSRSNSDHPQNLIICSW